MERRIKDGQRDGLTELEEHHVPVAPPEQVAVRTSHLLAVLAAAGLVLGTLALLVLILGEPTALDLAATAWLQQQSNPILGRFMLAVSWLGFWPQSVLVVLVAAGAFVLRGLPVEAMWVVGTSLASLLNRLLKLLIERPRPTPEMVRLEFLLTDFSFPSGHVVFYTTFFGFAFFLVYVLVRPAIWRSALLLALGLPIAWVGVSRMYLGHHWISDVLAGYALATLFLVPYCWAYVRLRLWKPKDQE